MDFVCGVLSVSSSLLCSSSSSLFPFPQGAKHWKASIHTESPSEIFPRDRLVYLSPDAEEPLTAFEKDKVVG